MYTVYVHIYNAISLTFVAIYLSIYDHMYAYNYYIATATYMVI